MSDSIGPFQCTLLGVCAIVAAHDEKTSKHKSEKQSLKLCECFFRDYFSFAGSPHCCFDCTMAFFGHQSAAILCRNVFAIENVTKKMHTKDTFIDLMNEDMKSRHFCCAPNFVRFVIRLSVAIAPKNASRSMFSCVRARAYEPTDNITLHHNCVI